MYIFHSIPEEMGQALLFAAQLRHMKHPETGQSMWDMYEVQDGELVYTGGTRGNIRNEYGEIVSLEGLHHFEVTKMKRISERLHGGYRMEERTALEVWSLGQWAIQFKRYLPSILSNMLESRYNDYTLGEWKKKEGEDIYEWQGRVHRGRARVILSLLKGTMEFVTGNKEWKNTFDDIKSTPESKKDAADFLATSALFGSLVFLLFALFGDEDDEDDPWKKRLARLRDDISSPYNILDMARSVRYGTTAGPKIFDFIEGTTEFAGSLFTGERIEQGETAGRYRGETNLRKLIPILSSKEELRYYGFIDIQD